MCPKKFARPIKPIRLKNSSGFLVPFAAILVVGIAILALAISDIASQSSQASTVEGMSIQAFYAAESGAHFGMNQLIFDVADRTTADANCTNLDGTSINFSAPGLQLCTAQITCTINSAVGVPESFYLIRSSAACGAGDILAERIVEVSTLI